MDTKWSFYTLTKVKLFATLLKDVPMGCKEPVLPKPLFKNRTVNCLIFGENTRQRCKDNFSLFRAVALILPGNEKLEEKTSKLSFPE